MSSPVTFLIFESAAHVLAVRRASLSPDVAGSRHKWNLLSAFFVAHVEKTPDLKKPLTSKFCGLELPTQKAKVQRTSLQLSTINHPVSLAIHLHAQEV